MVYNVAKKKKERVNRILRMHSNKADQIDSIEAGDIAVFIGLKEVQTGDTLYKIAREQQVPVQQLMKLNNFDDLASSNLRVGQQIRVN